MNTRRIRFGRWQRYTLIALLVIGGVWGGLKWAEKTYAKFLYKWDNECAGYEFQKYRAFSVLGSVFSIRDHPIFVRVIEKKTGRLIGETSVYRIVTGPDVVCLDKESPKQIRIYFGTKPSDEHLEAFSVIP